MKSMKAARMTVKRDVGITVTTNESEKKVKIEVTDEVEKTKTDIIVTAKRKSTKAAGMMRSEDVQENEEKTQAKIAKAIKMTENDTEKIATRNVIVDTKTTREATKENELEMVREAETEHTGERRGVIAEIGM